MLLDIRKALDTTDHEILLTKLDYYGIKNDELNFFMSYLNKRQSYFQVKTNKGQQSYFQVKTNKRQQSYFQVKRNKIRCSDPQGSIPGSLLFIVFMNDLPHFVENADVTMYANDTSATTAIRDLSDITSQAIPDLLKISDWVKANRLKLNTLKTEFMLIGTNWNLSKIGDLLALRIKHQTLQNRAAWVITGVKYDKADHSSMLKVQMT